MRLNYLVALTMGAAACGGGGVAVEDLPDELVDKVCSAQVECGEFPDLQTCRESIFIDLDIEGIQADIDAGIVNYDEDAADRCLSAYDALFNCELIFTSDLIDEVNEACDAVFQGTVAVGEACTEDFQCDGGDCEEVACPDQCCSGSCIADEVDERVEIGQSCAEADCVSGAYCEGESELCAARVAVGASCSDFDACVSGAICDLDFQSGMGTCVELNGEGGSCNPEMILFQCLRTDNFCDPTDSTCKPRLAVGEACLDNECVGYAECVDGTCVAEPGLGEACVVDSQLDCLGSLDCVGGTCVAEADEPYCPLGG